MLKWYFSEDQGNLLEPIEFLQCYDIIHIDGLIFGEQRNNGMREKVHLTHVTLTKKIIHLKI